MAIVVEPWRIPDGGRDVEGEETSDVLALGPHSHIQAQGPIRYVIHVQYVTHELIVSGMVSCRLRFECSRCADPVDLEVKDGDFFVEREVQNVHEMVDLTDEVRESIILAFPSYPLCQSACRGLCARCGVNLNKEHCDCSRPAKERWSAFSGLDNIEVKNGRTQKKKIKK
jgi:uncharacterized metal-binding protein YceD (DUF177 family)